MLGDIKIMSFYLNRLVKSAKRKIIRMPEAVRCFGVIFADSIGRRVAVVAGRNGMMARFLPAVILFPHDMTVGARTGIIAQIRITFGVNKGVQTDARRQPDGDS